MERGKAQRKITTGEAAERGKAEKVQE